MINPRQYHQPTAFTRAAMVLRLFRSIALALLLAPVAAAQSGDAWLRPPNHTAWTTSAVPALTGAYRIARSNDGYLWLNTAGGLLRFDGTRFVRFDSVMSRALLVRGRGAIRPLIVDKTGTLWFQRPDKSLVTYRDGVFRRVVHPDSALAVQAGSELGMDGTGQLYLYSLSRNLTFTVRDDRLQPVRWPPGFPTSGISRIVADTGRGMWIGDQGLWHVVNGLMTRVTLSAGTSNGTLIPLLQTRDGSLWITGFGARRGLARVVGGAAIPVRLADTSDIIDAYQAVEGPDGAVWISTRGRGVLVWHRGLVEEFTKRDGLTDVFAYDISVDAHGVAFAATPSGLDRFRPTPFVTLGRGDGVPVESPSRVVRDSSGSFWISGVDAPTPIELRVTRTRDGRDSIHAVRASLPAATYTLLGAARDSGVWISTKDGDLIRYHDGVVKRLTRANGLPGTPLRFAVEGRDGTLWIGTGQLDLWMSHGDRFAPAPVEYASDVVEDTHGRIWVADANAVAIEEIENGRVTRRLGRADGVRGFAGSLALEPDDVLWAMTDSGLVRVSDGRVSPVPGVSTGFIPRYGPNMLVAGGLLWFVSDSHV
ncbi:MAG TPA: hypothetical protein VMH39_11470, partial [Gemmatimonadaceae bacterium]|nr:hypothetical protein [Gemmatimonadaceae bacterium]